MNQSLRKLFFIKCSYKELLQMDFGFFKLDLKITSYTSELILLPFKKER